MRLMGVGLVPNVSRVHCLNIVSEVAVELSWSCFVSKVVKHDSVCFLFFEASKCGWGEFFF